LETSILDVTHLEESLQRDIDRISGKVRVMAALAEEALCRAMTALSQKNRQLAYSVILRDQRIDELEKELDRLCLEFIVRQQPVAKTLRFAYAAIKINSELERVGDYAESIARQVTTLCSLDAEIPYQRFAEISKKSIPMVRAAAEAFVAQDPELARATMEGEESVDRLRHELSSELVRMAQCTGDTPVAALFPLANIVNRLERVADQAKNICQEVLYLCTGQYLKHMGSEVFRVLFVDDDNSCLSQMAEALGTSLDQPKFVFWSGGLSRKPISSGTAEFLSDKGLDISGRNSKEVSQVPHLDQYQIVVALTKDARRVFPPPPTKAVCLDWSVRDPSLVTGSAEEVRAAYEQAYQFLSAEIRDLVKAVVDDQNHPGTEGEPFPCS
jgi:phosphate transport system protein